jgi:PAS domain S-box-containing protein
MQFGASYAWSVLITAVAALVRAGLGPLLGAHYPLGAFYAAVAVIGWFWGVGPAVLAAVLGYLAGAYLFLTPRAPPFGPDPHALEFVVYGLICSALIALVYRVYERQRRLDQALSAHADTRQTLAESDARFKRYLDALPDIVYTWKADGSQEYVSPRWAEYVGAPPMSDEAAAAVPADDARVLREERDGALRRGEPFRAQFRLRDRHGRLRWFLTRCVPIRDPNNSITGWVGTSIDVDDEKRAAEALELSERRYRSVSEAFDFGMWSADSAGRLTFVSPRFLAFLGVTLEGVKVEQVEVHVWSAIQSPAKEIREAAIRWERCKATGEPWEWEYSLRGHDGTVRRVWTRGIPLRGPTGLVSSWAGFHLDVTEQYTAARARDQARQRLEFVTNAMSVGVAQCNRQMEYVWVNPAYARGIGLTPEQIHGRTVEDVLGRAAFERLEPHFLRVLSGDPVECEGEQGTGLESNRWIHATYTPIWDAAPLPSGWVMVVSDLTQRRALEEELRDTNRRKDEFLATLAHELRNPLTPIRYATQLLKPGLPPEMAADARHMIDRQLAQMARLLDDLLDVSRITRGTLEIRADTVDLCAAVRYAVDASRYLAEAVQQDLRVELPDSMLPVRGDEMRLIQVIGNLINNAIKFTNPGGKIFVSAAAEGAMVIARVRDTGRGIVPQLLPRVFEMFVQGEPNSHAQSGLGIGLALAKQMIELHGGRIEAISEGAHRGSEFRVFLPLAAEVPAMQESLVDATKVSVLGADGIRVLVVDDNVDAADTLAQFLTLAGYHTRVAYDGRTALEMAEILEPAVVLLDIGLPYLNGYEVARRLRALPWGRTARLIALTGWGQEDDVRRSRESGFDEHFTKPVDPGVLLQRIIVLTRGRGTDGELKDRNDGNSSGG